MATFEVKLESKDGKSHSITRINAESASEARQIAKMRYSDKKIIAVVKAK